MILIVTILFLFLEAGPVEIVSRFNLSMLTLSHQTNVARRRSQMLYKFLAGAKNDARLHNILQSLILDLLFCQLLSTLFGT